MKPQPQRHCLAAILTAFTLLLAAGGAQAQTVDSVTAPDGFYMAGQSVPITVTFSEAVTVSGIPQLTLTTSNSGGEGVGTYTSGSGTVALIFTYTVRAGDNIGEYHGEGANVELDKSLALRALEEGPYIDDLAYTGTDALDLNGGTIGHATTAGISATTTLPAPGEENSLSHSSSVVLDTVMPTPISASVAADGARIDVVLSEALTPDSFAALESGEFTLGSGTSATVRDVVTTATTRVIVLMLTSPSYNPDAYYNPYNPNPPVVQADPTILPGETVTLAWANDGDSITDSAGNVLDDITDLDVTNEVVPVVESVAQPDFSRGFYKAGDTVSIAVNFSSSVTVTGIPQLTLVVGTSSASAQYVSGSPGTALIFNYIVADGHSTDSLAYSSANALTRNGGSIQSTDASTLAADLTLPEPGTFGSLNSDFFFPVVIDNLAPDAPSIDSDLIAGDDRISVAERNADGGVLITGSMGADAFTVTSALVPPTSPTGSAKAA